MKRTWLTLPLYVQSTNRQQVFLPPQQKSIKKVKSGVEVTIAKLWKLEIRMKSGNWHSRLEKVENYAISGRCAEAAGLRKQSTTKEVKSQELCQEPWKMQMQVELTIGCLKICVGNSELYMPSLLHAAEPLPPLSHIRILLAEKPSLGKRGWLDERVHTNWWVRKLPSPTWVQGVRSQTHTSQAPSLGNMTLPKEKI